MILTGLDALANAKRGSQDDGGFKVPKERTISIAASAEDEDKSESSVVDESGQGGVANNRKHTNRRYRETTNETSQAGNFLFLNINISVYRLPSIGFICIYFHL